MDNPSFKPVRRLRGSSPRWRFRASAQGFTDTGGADVVAGGSRRYRHPAPPASATLTTASRLAHAVSDESLFVSELPTIDAIIAQVCRRHHLDAAEAEEFASEARLRILERNYEVLRRFQGRSSLRTYLTVVVHRFFLDYRIRLWGKWRPSVEAQRLGTVAMLLERLVSRDRWSFEQAVELLRTNHGVRENPGQLWELYVRLRPCTPTRRFVSDEAAQDVPNPAPSPDANLMRAEQDFVGTRVRHALDRACRTLTPEERLIVKMRFHDGFPVSEIATVLHLHQKRLYRTIEGILGRLRASLVADGISSEDVTALFADSGGSRG